MYTYLERERERRSSAGLVKNFQTALFYSIAFWTSLFIFYFIYFFMNNFFKQSYFQKDVIKPYQMGN